MKMMQPDHHTVARIAIMISISVQLVSFRRDAELSIPDSLELKKTFITNARGFVLKDVCRRGGLVLGILPILLFQATFGNSLL